MSDKRYDVSINPARAGSEHTCSQSITEPERINRPVMINEDAQSDVLSQIYHALRARRRRILIRLIARSHPESITVRLCAQRIAAVENEIQPQAATGEPYRNVYNALSQTHLSTLSDAGIAIYDSDRQVVSAGPNLQLGMLILTLTQVTYQTLQEQYLTEVGDWR